MKLNKDHEKHAVLYQNGFLFDASNQTVYTNKTKKSLPPEYENWEIEKTKLEEYCEERLAELGITEEENSIELIGGVNLTKKQKATHKVFAPNKFGDIEILQYDLHRKPYTFTDKGAETNSTANREHYNVQTRLHPLHVEMCEGKYDFSKAKNAPFFHKTLIEAYEKGEIIETLCLTEGQFKAFKSCMDGIPTVGLTSISHFKSKETGTIHADIIDIIRKCQVSNLIILWDGDCRNISSSALESGEDLTKRPGDFYRFACKIRTLIQDFFSSKKLKIYFATINSNELKNEPKGIDDLLVEYSKDLEDVKKDIQLVGDRPGKYFSWVDITMETGVKRLNAFFNLSSVKAFYNAHQELIQKRDFVFFRSTYGVEKGEPIKKIDANVKNYKRIGPDWYKIQLEPIPTGKKDEVMLEEVLNPWTKSAIMEDHGKDIIPHIERYEGFTNHASHTDYKKEINGFWNLYYNVDHNERPGEFPHIEKLLKHIFQEQYTMILDYISVLYRQPRQKLPVVCLVSRKQKTGKSTFVYLMKLIFKQNMALISNSDLVGDFNSQWTSKLIVASEETMLEKKDAYEKIKAISTAREIMRNEKNKTARSIPCMVHFIFCSNHEDNFIRIDDYDSRLWIRKVDEIKESIKNFDEHIENEIPYFVDFIQNREIEYNDTGERLFFRPKDFRTAAFDNVVQNSEPTIIKELREHLIDSFLSTGVHKQSMTVAMIKQHFGIRADIQYLKKAITDTLGIDCPNTSYCFNYFDNNKELAQDKGKGRRFEFFRENFVRDKKYEDQEEDKYVQTSILDYES